jgi:hypothetical protein
MPLDEKALRKSNFTPGCPVVLADGQTWELALPVMTWRRSRAASGFAVRLPNEEGHAYQDLFESWEKATGDAIMESMLMLGESLLLANYNLTPEQVDEILVFSTSADGQRIQKEVMAAAMGRGPKAMDDGGE